MTPAITPRLLTDKQAEDLGSSRHIPGCAGDAFPITRNGACEPSSGAFTSAMADHFQRISPTMTRDYAHLLAVGTLAEFLKDEGVEFGADGYAWDAEGAAIIAEEYETRHWEAV